MLKTHENKAYWRALHSLGHPVTITAVVMLLINDHWLRYAAPSWLTGKLGDAAWLIFAPLLGALALALLIPTTHPAQEKKVGWISFGWIAIWFASAKTLAPVHAVTTTVLDALVGWEGSLGMDPTDLVTLPALLLGWWIWRQAENQPRRTFSGVPVVMVLALLGTVATSCEVGEWGITYTCEINGTMYLGSNHRMFRVADGELEPLGYDDNIMQDCLGGIPTNPPAGHQGQFQAGTEQIRYIAGDGIYSTLPGEVERRIYDLSTLNHDTVRRYYEGDDVGLVCGKSVIYAPGPFDAIYAPQTETLYFAMGYEGVLQRTADGTWSWIAVGDYHHVDMDNLDTILDLLQDEIIVALGLVLLIPPTIAVSSRRPACLWLITYVSMWLIWLSYRTVLGEFFIPLTTHVLFGLGAILNIWLIMTYRGHFRHLVLSVALAAATAALFLLPYILWARRTVPNFGTATLFAYLLAFTGTFTGKIIMRRYYTPASTELSREVDPNTENTPT